MVVITRVLGPLIRFSTAPPTGPCAASASSRRRSSRRCGRSRSSSCSSARRARRAPSSPRRSRSSPARSASGRRTPPSALVPRPRSVRSIDVTVVDLGRAGGRHRPLAVPRGGRRPRRRPRRGPRQGRVRRALRGAASTSGRAIMVPRSSCPRRATSPTCSPTCAARGPPRRRRRRARRHGRDHHPRGRPRGDRRRDRRRARPAPHRLTGSSGRASGCSTAPCTPTRCSTPAASHARRRLRDPRRLRAGRARPHPRAGEGFDHDGWRVEVVELDGLRVAAVRLRASPGGGRRS